MKKRKVFLVVFAFLSVFAILLPTVLAYAATSYKVTYKLNGGVNNKANPKTFTQATATIKLKDPTKTGYIFKGWYSDAKYKTKVTEIKKGTKKNITLYAKWEDILYTIKFNSNGGTGKMTSLTKRKYGSKYTLPANKYKKTGMYFMGWSKNKNGTGTIYKDKASVSKLTTKNNGTVTLYAVWDYKITYKLNGGKNASNPTYYNPKVDTALKNPTKTNNAFVGWYKDAKLTKKITKIAKGSKGNITLYAKWTNAKFSIKYNLNGGTNNKANPSTYLSTAETALKNPTKTGYTFNGWYKESNFKTKVTKIAKGTTGNLTLYAKWSPVRYTITYVLNGGSLNNPQDAYYITTATFDLPTPSKSGYIFAGWYLDPDFQMDINKIVKGSMGNIKVYAKYEVDGYQIKYHLNGGTNHPDNPASYNKNDGEIILKEPTKEGCEFEGWYTSSDFDERTYITKIDSHLPGNMNLYARWSDMIQNAKLTLKSTDINIDLNSPFTILATTTPAGHESEIVWSLKTSNENFTLNGNVITGVSYDTFNDSVTVVASFQGETKEVRVKLVEFKGECYTFDLNDRFASNYPEGYNLEGTLYVDEYNTGCGYEPVIPSSHNGYNVTAIRGAFNGMGLDKVTIPEGIKIIENYSFDDNNFKNVTLPNSLLYLGYRAFSYNKLTSIEIPENLREIPDFAFQNNKLKEVVIPGTVKKIGTSAFDKNKIQKLTLNEGLETIEDNAFENNMIHELVIPNSVTTLNSYAFAQNRITKVKLGSGLTTLNTSLFYENSITGIEIPDNIQEIKRSAFYGNKIENLVIPDSVTVIGDEAFSNNEIKTLSLPDELTDIGERAFSVNKLSSVTIPSKLTEIPEYLFYNNEIEEVIFNNVLTKIGGYAFYQNKISELLLPSTLVEIDTFAFGNNRITNEYLENEASIKNLSFNEGLMKIGDYAFISCELEEVNLPSTLEEIGENAFSQNKITNLTIPNSVETMGINAFRSNEIETLNLGSGLTIIPDGAFASNHIKNLVVPEGVTDIGVYDDEDWKTSGAFSSNWLETVSLPSTLRVIGDKTFENTNTMYSNPNEFTSIVIPDGVISIGSSAFEGCEKLTDVTIGSGVQNIKWGAFDNDPRLTLTIKGKDSIADFNNFVPQEELLFNLRFLGRE